jgi:hypothetical protein
VRKVERRAKDKLGRGGRREGRRGKVERGGGGGGRGEEKGR